MARRRSVGSAKKTIFDPIHGPISLDGVALALLSTPEFQRLWGIRQTGFAHLVFPGANHTRLEHSLGTYWVAEQMAARLELSAQRSERVAVAGLLHDLGHPPFSHTLDGPMQEVLGCSHEQISRARIVGADPGWPTDPPEIPAALERFHLDPREVADLIDPPTRSRAPPLLRAILHGPIDADRIDYLQRDAHYTGVGHGAIDAVRLLDTMRPLRGRLAFAEKGRSAVEGFLVGRTLMYSTVYYHKTVRAAEMMAQSAVERMPGYPDGARALFGLNDGELLVRLSGAGGASAELTEGLLARRLFKRAHGWRTILAADRGPWRRLVRSPESRRHLEDEVAERVGAPRGSVLIDLAGLEAHAEPGEDWEGMGLLVGGRVTFPFRGPGPWQALANRAPADWAVNVYVAPRYRESVSRVFARGRDPFSLSNG
ncbi:MAG TPA: HD domain-containing protein [Thermoplasmata archaeon]|nr:HD domain-containing protein [Thermoplasmata archaeon]